MTITRTLARTGAAAALSLGVLSVPVAAHADTIGNGTTAPTHDSGTAVIPLCNPINVIKWLDVNFTDHGRDIANYRFTLKTPTDIVQYAGTDALFHLPATLVTLGGLTQAKKYCTLSYAPKTGS